MAFEANNRNIYIATALCHIAERFSDSHASSLSVRIPYIASLKERGIAVHDWCGMRTHNNAPKKADFQSEEDHWLKDAALLELIKQDPEKAKTLQRIVAFTEAAIPQDFNPKAKNEELIATSEGFIYRNLSLNLRNVKTLVEAAIPGFFEPRHLSNSDKIILEELTDRVNEKLYSVAKH